MTIPLPDLDNLTYADLIEQARSQISNECPEWTDHNPTDTGIILLELLAWLSEILIYRVNRIPDRNIETFLTLLNGPDWKPTQDLQTEVRKTVLKLRQRYRAVSQEDFEQLVLEDWQHTDTAKAMGSEGKIGQVKCLKDLKATIEPETQTEPAMGHITLVVVPQLPDDLPNPQPSANLRRSLWTWLDDRRLLTTRHHVVGPRYVPVQVSADLYLEEGALPSKARSEAVKAMQQFFHPLEGGQDGKGWSLGRAIYVSEVYQRLERVPGVDHIRALQLQTPDATRLRQQDGILARVALQNHELVNVTMSDRSFSLMERLGDKWQAVTDLA